MSTPKEQLEAMLNEVERERMESDTAREQAEIGKLHALLTQHLSDWLRLALGLAVGFSDGRAVADGTYRDRTLRLYREDGDWMLVVSGWRQPICMTYQNAELEDRLLGRLVELRADMAAAAEVPPVDQALGYFHLEPTAHGIGLIVDGGRDARHFADLDSLGVWLSEAVAPLLVAAQQVATQAEPSSETYQNVLIPMETFRTLYTAFLAYQEALR